MSLKNPALSKGAIAQGVKRAYTSLFAANEKANELDAPTLKGLIAQVTGADATVVAKVLGTLQALLKQSDFLSTPAADSDPGKVGDTTDANGTGLGQKQGELPPDTAPHRSSQLRPEFHYNIQVHLPANATEETYLHIFNAMRKAFVTWPTRGLHYF